MEITKAKKVKLETYNSIYRMLSQCFDESFGDGKTGGKIPLSYVQDLIVSRSKEDYRHGLPGNSLIEF